MKNRSGKFVSRKIESPETSLLSHMMNGQHSLEWQSLCMHKHRHQRRRPIVHVQNLQLRRQPPRQFERRFAEENKSRGIVFVRLAVLAVNSRAIEKLIAANQKQLHAAGAPALEVPGDVSLVADLHIDSDAGVFLLKRAILP